jgi:hypothetical protein
LYSSHFATFLQAHEPGVPFNYPNARQGLRNQPGQSLVEEARNGQFVITKRNGDYHFSLGKTEPLVYSHHYMVFTAYKCLPGVDQAEPDSNVRLQKVLAAYPDIEEMEPDTTGGRRFAHYRGDRTKANNWPWQVGSARARVLKYKE